MYNNRYYPGGFHGAHTGLYGGNIPPYRNRPYDQYSTHNTYPYGRGYRMGYEQPALGYGAYNEPYHRLYYDPYISDPYYQQFGNITYNDNALHYKSGYNRMDGYGSTYSSGNQNIGSFTSKDDLRRIRYLLVLLGMGGTLLFIIWKRYLKKYWSIFVRRWFMSNVQRTSLTAEDEEKIINTLKDNDNEMIAEYDDFLKRQKNIKIKDSLQEKEIDDLLNLVNEQYNKRIKPKFNGENNNNNNNRSEKIELKEKIVDDVKLFKKHREEAIAYLKRIDKMNEQELRDEFKRLSEEKFKTTRTEEESLDFTAQFYTKIIQDHLSRKGLFSPIEQNAKETSNKSPKDETRNIVQEYIEKEEEITKKCKDILRTLYIEEKKQDNKVKNQLNSKEQITDNVKKEELNQESILPIPTTFIEGEEEYIADDISSNTS